MAELGLNSVILDIGAGTGRQTILLARQEMNVVAVDFAVNMLTQLAKQAEEMHLDSRVSAVVADIVAQPFRDEVFDGVEMVAALHHVPTRELRTSAVHQIFRVIRMGGRAVVSVWFRGRNGFYRSLISSALRALWRTSEWGDVCVPWSGRPRFYHLFSMEELKSLFSASGFHIERIGVQSFGDSDAKGINRNIFLLVSKT